MALLYLGEDPWLLEHESCEKLHRVIMEQLTQRESYPRSSDKYGQISSNIRLRLKQYNNEVDQLKQKLDVAETSCSITPSEGERRARQIEVLAMKAGKMQKIFDQQVSIKAMEERRDLLENIDLGGGGSSAIELTAEEMRERQKKMLGEQEQGLESLTKIISRQKNIASTISNEVDLHNEILDDIGTEIDRTDTRVREETKHVSVVDRKDKTCAYWIVILLLFLSIVVVAVI